MKIIISFLLIAGLISCSKKEERLEKTASYANVLFINNSILGANVGLMYMGEPIGFNGTVLSGMGKFTFYNKRTDSTLLETELDIQADQKEAWYFFQPDSTGAAQLLRNTQVNEPAAPAGYMKLKIVNLSKIALTNATGVPYPKVDIIIQSTLTNAIRYAPFDTIRAIGTRLDTANYYLVKKPIRAGAVQDKFKFSFLDHETKTPLLSSGGPLFLSIAFNAPLTGKNVYTVYITDIEATLNAVFFLKNNKYYDIRLNLLFN